jgi:hypothetical protein
MRFLLMLLLGLLMAAQAGATTGTRIDDGFPPVLYQGDAVLVVHLVSRPLPNICGPTPSGYQLNGCTPKVGEQEIWLPNPCSSEFAGQSFARWACHEMGHANGWPADHPR